MVSFFKHGSPNSASKSEMSPESAGQSVPQQSGDVQRALIRVVFKNTLHRQGIPLNWLACDLITEAHAGGEETLHIQLVLLKWNETFLRYAPALEAHLRQGLDRFDPNVDHSKYVISWRFSPECECPFKVMPPARFWAHEEGPVVETPPPPARQEYRDEPPRPMVMRTATEFPPASEHEETLPSPLSDEYERTQLSPLR